jgi:acylphosphatase
MAGVVRLEVTVRGRVQGVGFRYFVLREARRLGLTGWVANEFDGSVTTVVEGPESAIDLVEAAIRAGPIGAVVEHVSAVRMPGSGTFPDFVVRAGAHRGD